MRLIDKWMSSSREDNGRPWKVTFHQIKTAVFDGK
jgi:hypothetical protein